MHVDPPFGGLLALRAASSVLDMTTTQNFTDKLDRLAVSAREAAAARDAHYEAAWRAKYAEYRAADKAAGKDVSGKSVQNRRCAAMDAVIMGDAEYRRLRDAAEAARLAYREALA